MRTVEINGSFYSLQRPSSYLALVRGDAGRLRLRGEGRTLPHAQQEAPRLRAAARELLRVGRAGARGEARARSSGSSRRSSPFDARAPRGRSSRILPRTTAAAAELARGHDARLQARRLPRRARRSPCATRSRSGTRRYDDRRSSSSLRKHDVALVRRRHGGQVAVPRGRDRRLRLRAPARRQEALRERLSSAALDRWADRVAAWRDGGSRAMRSSPRPGDATRARHATSSSTSTTT